MQPQHHAPNGARRGRALLKNGALSLLSVGVTLGLLEGGVRLFAPVPLVASDLFLQMPASVQARSARRALAPNVSCRHVSSEFDVGVRINAQGLRDVPHSFLKPRGVKRVLVLGDSFTFGYGVEEQQRFSNLLQARLDAAHPRGPRFEVINAGVPSWGTEDELLFWREEGWKYRPDVVLLCFYRNDVNDNRERDLFALRGGVLREKPRVAGSAPRGGIITRDPINNTILAVGHQQTAAARAPRPSWLTRHSQLARLLRLALRPRTPAPDQGRDAQMLTASLFETLVRETQAKGARFKLMLIPDKTDFARRGTLDGFPLLAAWQRGQPPGRVLDLLPVLRRDGAGQLYFQRDAHLNPRGHAALAPALQAFVAP